MNTLISHTQNSTLLNKALYSHYGNELYLINNFTPFCKVLELLQSRSRRICTETPLYVLSSAQRSQYIDANNIRITEEDLEFCVKLIPLCATQAKRLIIKDQSLRNIFYLILDLFAYWKTFLISNQIDRYLCWLLPHQLSDFILFETANRYCMYTETTYASTMGLTLRMVGSFVFESMKIIDTKSTINQRVGVSNVITKYLESKLSPGILDNKTGKNLELWLKHTVCTDPTKSIGQMPINSYIIDYLTKATRESYLNSLHIADSISESSLPANGNIILLLNVEPEAAICPMAAPFLSITQFISHIRSIIPSDVTIYLKEHPGAYDPTHRVHKNGTEVLACVSERNQAFFSQIKSLPNIRYLAPWLYPQNWLYCKDLYAISLGSTAVFELDALGTPVAVVGTTMLAIEKKLYHTHSFSKKSVCDYILSNKGKIHEQYTSKSNMLHTAFEIKHHPSIADLPWNLGELPIEFTRTSSLNNIMHEICDYERELRT